MFHRWGMRHGDPAFAWGGHGPQERWQGWNAEQEQEHGEQQNWQGWPGQHGGHGPGPGWHGEHGPGRHGGHGPGPGWHGEHGPGPGGPWGGGPGGPPWMRHGGMGFGGPALAWWLWSMRRGFGGPGPGPGRGPGGRGPRAFGRGDLKYQLLALLTERPKHGYEMIKELEEQAGGFYTPSAGAVYPSLQLMEDRGWITSQTADSKKVYTITDAGREALKEHQQQAEEFGGPWGWGGAWQGHHGGPFGPQARPELEALRNEGVEVARLLVMAVMHASGDPAKLARVREIISSTRRQLQDLLNSTPESAPGPEPKTQKLNHDAKPDEYI